MSRLVHVDVSPLWLIPVGLLALPAIVIFVIGYVVVVVLAGLMALVGWIFTSRHPEPQYRYLTEHGRSVPW